MLRNVPLSSRVDDAAQRSVYLMYLATVCASNGTNVRLVGQALSLLV